MQVCQSHSNEIRPTRRPQRHVLTSKHLHANITELTGQFYFVANGSGGPAVKEEKRRKILEAAEALFSRGRFHEITMDDVARKAGVGKGTIYRYFKDKDDLFFELAMSGYDELCEMVRAEGERGGEFRSCLVSVCRSVTRFHTRRRQLIHVMQAEDRRALWQHGEARKTWHAHRMQLVASLVGILEKGRAAGDVRNDMELDVLAMFLLGMLRTRGRARGMDRHLEVDHEQVVDLFLHGASKS